MRFAFINQRSPGVGQSLETQYRKPDVGSIAAPKEHVVCVVGVFVPTWFAWFAATLMVAKSPTQSPWSTTKIVLPGGKHESGKDREGSFHDDDGSLKK